jgi:adenylosuccinate lyase
MPHKRNPQLCQDIIGITNEIRALAPLALESALSEHEGDNAPSDLFDIQQHACELTAESLTRVQVVISGLRTNPKRMRRNLDLSAGMISSEAVMLRLGHIVGRQIAHEVVYDATQSAVTTSTSFADALAADPRVTDHLDAQTIKRLLEPDSYLGMAPTIARTQAARARATIASSERAQRL